MPLSSLSIPWPSGACTNGHGLAWSGPGGMRSIAADRTGPGAGPGARWENRRERAAGPGETEPMGALGDPSSRGARRDRRPARGGLRGGVGLAGPVGVGGVHDRDRGAGRPPGRGAADRGHQAGRARLRRPHGGHPLGAAPEGRRPPPGPGGPRHGHVHGRAGAWRRLVHLGRGPRPAARARRPGRLRGDPARVRPDAPQEPAQARPPGGVPSPWGGAVGCPVACPRPGGTLGARGSRVARRRLGWRTCCGVARGVRCTRCWCTCRSPSTRPACSATACSTGLAVSLLAAVTGFADYLLIEGGTRTWKLATTHMTVMLVASVAFLGGALLRARDLDVTATSAGPFALSLAGAGLLVTGALLGGDLVYRHGRRVERWPAARGGDPVPDRDRDQSA